MSGHPTRWQLLFKRSSHPDSENRKATTMPYGPAPPMPPAVEAHRTRRDHPLERSPSRPSNRSSGRPSDRTSGRDRPSDRPLDRTSGRPLDRSLDRPFDYPLDRPLSRPSDHPSSRHGSRPSSRQSTPVSSPALSSVDHFSSRTSLGLSKKPSSLAANDSNFKLQTFKYDATLSNTTVTHKINGYNEVWVQERRLGGGAYGDVYLQRSKDARNSVRAVKAITRSAHMNDIKAIKRELNALITLRKHKDHFVDFYGWYEATDNSGTVFIAMEYISAGDLSTYMEDDPALAKENCKTIVRQILEALVIMHQHDFCHRDLKPQNVLVASTSPLRLKLADFGIAKSTSQDSVMRTAIGTSKYIAPEVYNLLNLGPEEEYSQAVDMWALGTIAHEIMTGSIPFCAPAPTNNTRTQNDKDNAVNNNDSAMFSGITFGNSGRSTKSTTSNTNIRELIEFCDGKRDFPLARSANGKLAYSSIFKDFILCVLVPQPTLRLTAARALEHPWINESVALVEPWHHAIKPPVSRTWSGFTQTERFEAERFEAERLEVERQVAEDERIRLARARILGLTGVIRATKVFRGMVPPRPTVTDEEEEEEFQNYDSYRGTERRDETRYSGDQYSEVDYAYDEAEFEAERDKAQRAAVERARAARARAEHAEAERAEAERVDQERRSKVAKANILGLTGMLKAVKRFRQAVPRPEATDADDPGYHHPRREDVYVRHSQDRREDSRHSLDYRDREDARHSQDWHGDARQQQQGRRAKAGRLQHKHISEAERAFLAAETERRMRSKLARSRLLGLTGVLKATKKFRQLSVSHQTHTDHAYTDHTYTDHEDLNDDVDPLDTGRPAVESQRARLEREGRAQREAEAERVRQEKAKAKAKANILGITGMFKAIKQFRRNVPTPAAAAPAPAPVIDRDAEEIYDPLKINHNIKFTQPQYQHA